MTDEQTGPSKATAGIAASLPVLFTLASCCVLPLAATGDADPARAELFVQQMGMWFYVVAGVGAFAALLCAVLMFLSARGKRVPAAITLFVATLPWLAGLAGTTAAIGLATEAVQFADPASRATLMAQGIAEASTARLMGAWIGASLLSAVGLGWALAALGQRAADRRGIGALLAVCASLPVLGLVGFAFLGAGPKALILSLPGLALVLGAGMAAAGAGRDAPRFRSGAMAAAAPLALGLSFVATAVAVHTGAVTEIFAALATAPPDAKLELLAAAAEDIAPVRLVATWSGVAMLLPVAAVGVWAATRGKTSGGRIVGAVLAILVAASLPAADALVSHRAGEALAQASASPWDGVEGFTPIAMPAANDGGDADALLLADGRMQRVGDAQPSDRAQVLPGLVQSGEPSVQLAIDASTPADTLRQVVRELVEAEATSLLVVGAGEPPLPPARRQSILRNAPMLALIGDDIGGVVVELGPRIGPGGHLREGLSASPATSARTATVGADAARELHDVSGQLPPLSLDAPARRDEANRFVERGSMAYLAIGDDATAGSFFGTAAAAARHGFIPVILLTTGDPEAVLRSTLAPADGAAPGVEAGEGRPIPRFERLRELGNGEDIGVWPDDPIDGTPDAPGDAASAEAVLGRQLGDAARQAELHDDVAAAYPARANERNQAAAPVVRGSLSRDVIQRVVRQHQSQIRHCYERVLVRDPNLAGSVLLKIVISPEGEVSTATVEDSSLDSGTVQRCITRAARGWRFPPPEGGGVVVVTYPFSFQSS